MKLHHGREWMRRGFSLLWDPRALADVVEPGAVRSMRDLFAMKKAWPEELPGSKGNALVVAGLDGCLDCLSEPDAIEWIEGDLRPAVLSFQDHYQGQAALILWVASGRTRVGMDLADEEYFWRTLVKEPPRLPLGRCLWVGADSDVERILIARNGKEPDPDGDAYVGLHHLRIS